MRLLGQDIVILAKLCVDGWSVWTYSELAHDLDMSPSVVHYGLKRCIQAKLFNADLKRPIRDSLLEFLVHGVKYAFPPDLGTWTRGVPTAFASPKLKGAMVYDEGQIYVWPHPEGLHSGISFSPLYNTVPEVAMRDQALYEILGLIDALRLGNPRESRIAVKELERLLSYGD